MDMDQWSEKKNGEEIEITAEGFVSRRQPNTTTAVASGSRCALTN
jgi:hypothetical protein